MKTIVISCAMTAVMIFAAQAQAVNSERTRKLTAEQRRAKREAKIKDEGGLCTAPYNGRYVVIENAQSIVEEKDLMPEETSITQIFHYPVKIVGKGVKVKKTGVHITVSEDAHAPTLLVAPESPWAQVSVKALAADGAKKEVVIARTQKEIWRAFLMCCGASNSNMQPCVLRTIRNLEDIDAQSVRVPCPESLMKIVNAGTMLGLDRPVVATYKEACEQGWAPAPTNELQKALFESARKTAPEK